MKKPDSFILSADAKGFSLTDFSTWGLTELSNPEGRKMGAVEAFNDVGWTRRCVSVRGKALAGMPFGIYRGDTLVWSEQLPQPAELAWLNLWDYLYRAEISLALNAASYALKEGTFRQSDATIRRMSALRWWNPTTVTPHYQGPKDERGMFTQFRRTVNGTTEDWDRRLVLHIFQPDPFTEQGVPASSDGSASAINSQILADHSGYTSEQLRSGLVKKTVWVAQEGRPMRDEEKKRTIDKLKRYLYGRGKEDPVVMTGNIDSKTIGASLDELSEMAISKEQQETIATALGVPHSLVMSNAANFATAQADQVNFITTTVLFQARLIQEAMNEQLFGQLGLELRFEPDRLEVMQAIEAEKAMAIVPLVDAGIYSVGYAQEVLNVPEEHRQVATRDDSGGNGSDDLATQDELRKWRKKVEKRGATVKFTTEHIHPDDAEVIRERLAVGMELDAVFRAPFV